MVALLAVAVAAPGEWVEVRQEVLHTEVSVRVREEHADVVPLLEAVFRDVELRANEWRSDSPIGRLNAAAGQGPVPVDADLRALIRRSQELGVATDGAFDVTWAALWGLWDFSATPALPDADALAGATRHVGGDRVVIDDVAGSVSLPDPAMRVGLGAISKGWALDRAATLLAEQGVDDYLLRAGGQVLAHGDADGRPWRVGVRDPRGDDAFALLDVTDVSVSTSGDYERFFFVDGVRYHHVLDPRTGWPGHAITSATVVAADATTADALSTALLVLEPAAALEAVRALGVEAVLVRADGAVLATPGVQDRLTVLRPPGVGP